MLHFFIHQLLNLTSFNKRVLIWGLSLFLITTSVFGQQLEFITHLDAKVQESSGLIYLNNRLITHTDSGGEAKLYEIDTITGDVIRTVSIVNAINVDWEDICYDDKYIYIGDFGNNTNTRTDLKIYKISIQDYLQSEEVTAEVISYEYAEQTDFSSNNFNAEFDAEALFALEDNLYIFTKNWADQNSSVYVLPKTPGHYVVTKKEDMHFWGLITGADICKDTEDIILLGHNFSPFVVSISNYDQGIFSLGKIESFELSLPPNSSFQSEGIAVVAPNIYYISTETNLFGKASLYRLDLNTEDTTNIELTPLILYPNPATDYLKISTNKDILIKIYNEVGQEVLSTYSKKIDISHLISGIYTVKISSIDLLPLAIQKLVVLN